MNREKTKLCYNNGVKQPKGIINLYYGGTKNEQFFRKKDSKL